ncbi:hypothetical protein FDP41_003309 [Naegleria fowleri]|uniref:Saposin B-type domain-containing protein n=1 Tax=Naegleria fowleri TaxID=5763 RepID=A0A6A5BLU1_NAEFO|nr:uncharacterized protein FDP41_003309 [Naegleria fowleri]KAF0977987.1 hypothetical protein FDP41_003309 [Naegleria fowleri]CAG4715703.1 unnamed protein product [Naegleria fowleri]
MLQHHAAAEFNYKGAAVPLEYSQQKVCQVVVGLAQYKLLSEKKSISVMEQELIHTCTNSAAFNRNQTMMNTCHELVISFFPHVLSEMIADHSPKTICQRQDRGYKLVMSQVKDENRTKYICNVCQLIVYEVELFIAQNESMTQLTHKLEEVCTTVPTAYQAICIYTVQQYLPTFIEEVEHELSPLVSCQEIGYCPENPTDSKRIDHSPPIKMKRANTERIASRLISIKSILNK